MTQLGCALLDVFGLLRALLDQGSTFLRQTRRSAKIQGMYRLLVRRRSLGGGRPCRADSISLDEGRRREVVWATLRLQRSERWWGSMSARTDVGVTPEAAVISAVTSSDGGG